MEIRGPVLLPARREDIELHTADGLTLDSQNRPIVLYCKTGVRSAEALAVLTRAGFSDATHLRGGVLAWAQQIDPSLPVY